MKKINQQALQCGECGYAHAAQLKQYRLISLGGVEKKLSAVVNWHCHREAPGAALQSLING